MKNRKFMLLVCFWFIFLCFGCASIYSPLKTHFENNFSDFKIPEKDKLKGTAIQRTYQSSYDNVWDSALIILHQNTIIAKMSKESDFIAYIDIDGLWLEEKFRYWEFPFTILVEKDSKGTTVYVYPMTYLFENEKEISGKEWWKTVKMGFNQKGEEFLEKLTVQLTTKDRWPWLVTLLNR
jgi:hypothetical protein